MVIFGCAALVPIIFYLIGFTPVIAAGALSRFADPQVLLKKPSEGSLAAAWHASIGNVVAGSIFATLQSLGTAPSLLAAIGALIGVVGCSIHYLWKIFQGDGEDSESHKCWIWGSEKAQKRL